MLKSYILLFNTIKFLKVTQIFYQIWYRAKKKFITFLNYKINIININKLSWFNVVYNNTSLINNNVFKFLNIEHEFDRNIDWDIEIYSKLWVYNLNYFDYLNQDNISLETGLQLMDQFCDSYDNLETCKEPYPTSLRIINWIKFTRSNDINDVKYLKIIREDTNRLYHNIEYHLLGNHLLENGFALLFSGYLFNDKKVIKKSRKILFKQLDEQILVDGGHFELSPMYHQIILFRILDSINLLQSNFDINDRELLDFLVHNAQCMLSWLEQITFETGNIPLVNDSAYNIAPRSELLSKYSKELSIVYELIPLSESGYRKVNFVDYEALVDIGSIGASYQPGHAHADTFNFILDYKNSPIIVDTGTSTYNCCRLRDKERSTSSHNTVSINYENSSEVWGGFRVGNRANVKIEIDKKHIIKAQHDGYLSQNIMHRRSFIFERNKFEIIDEIGKSNLGEAHFHFHPDCNIIFNKYDSCVSVNLLKIKFNNYIHIDIVDYEFSDSFNKTTISKKIIVKFKAYLETFIIDL